MHVSPKHVGTGEPAWRSPWVIGWIGLVVAVLCVNLTMVYFAITTNPGLVNDDYYQRGQDYEKHLASRLAKDPGWTMKAEIPGDVRAGVPTSVRIVLADKAGHAVAPEQVTFFAYRPSDKTRDFSIPMTDMGGGRFVARLEFPLYGYWDWLMAVRQGADEYTTGGRLVVAKP
jgi:nitrogen fixation protein FixH